MGFKANQINHGNVASSKGGATKPTHIDISPLEAEILLNALQNAIFKGEMIETVHPLMQKLKTRLEK